MKMKEILKAENIVEEILERYPRTRNNDHILYRAYHFELVKRGLVEADFETFFTHPEEYKACNFATIERCRRKLQHYRPELGNIETKINREYLQAVFKEYSEN